ncbi:twin-arginine translocation signal domain-containing protein [Candidatus Latescibacterota bacterium]
MRTTRREFIKDAAAVGASVTACSMIAAGDLKAEMPQTEVEEERCPYFDQPKHCKGQSANGKFPCEE